MLIERKSALTGITHQREIDVTQEQIHRWKMGELIQNVMSHLSADDREFIKTGITPEEWDKAFPAEPDVDVNPVELEEDELTTLEYLKGLQERLMKIPASYGVDQYDVDRIGWIIAILQPVIDEEAEEAPEDTAAELEVESETGGGEQDVTRYREAAKIIVGDRNPATDGPSIMVTLEGCVTLLLLALLQLDPVKAEKMLTVGLVPGVKKRLALYQEKKARRGA